MYGNGKYTQSGGSNNVAGDLNITLNAFNLSGGALFASNIVVDQGVLTITNSTTVASPGTCLLAGTLQVLNSSISLGRLVASNSAVLDLGAGTSTAAFQPSSTVLWPVGSTLVVSNWHGNTNGGGLTRFIVGTNGSGLSVAQLAQTAFVNPAGFASGTYGARILATGEVVPTQSAFLSLARVGQQLVLTWPGALTLQSATNVSGPYTDVTGVSSPFTNPVSTLPKQFFRLRR